MSNENRRKTWSSKQDLAKRFKTCTKTIDRMRERGELPPPVQLTDRIIRWDDELVDAFLAKRTGLGHERR